MMMRDERRKDLVECCVLIADVNETNYYYRVPVQKIEESIKTIELTFSRMNKACSRVYISGFTLENKDSLLNREGIIDKVVRETQSNIFSRNTIKSK